MGKIAASVLLKLFINRNESALLRYSINVYDTDGGIRVNGQPICLLYKMDIVSSCVRS